MTFHRIAALSLVTGLAAPVTAKDDAPSAPAPNSYLSAATYGVGDFNPARTNAFPFGVPRGTFHIEFPKFQRILGGPASYLQLASTDPNYMWVTTTGAVAYADVSKDGGFRQVAQLATPGQAVIAPTSLEKLLAQPIASAAHAETVAKELGVGGHRLDSNAHLLVDKENVLYASTGEGVVHAYGLANPKKPADGIKLLRSLDLRQRLNKLASASKPSASTQAGAVVTGINLTYDGYLVIGSNRSITVTGRYFDQPLHTIDLGANQVLTNSIAVDDKGGIYVASDTTMYKLVWDGKKLSKDVADGAWSSPYDLGREPPSVKVGGGTGSTPALMGFGSDPDKLVVITDGADRMKVVAFWRDGIPSDFKQQPGTKSRRIAGQLEITAGLAQKPEFIQSEQAVVVKGYGAFVVDNVRRQGAKDKLLDVLGAGPVYDSPLGVERLEWDPAKDKWRSVWTRGDVVATSMAPAVSTVSNIVFVSGYTKQDGWELTGLDWTTGKTVHRSLFGQDPFGNGAYAFIQFLPKGDLLFNSIGGPVRVHYPAVLAAN